MNIDIYKRNVALSRGSFSAFIPHRLEIAWNPELDIFPFNVLFMSHTVRDGQKVTGSVLYEPEFHTYKKEGPLSSMRYRNIYGGDCYIMISFDEEKKVYCGEKFINGECVTTTDGGNDWQLFFTHLTMTGLSDGERCLFEPFNEPNA